MLVGQFQDHTTTETKYDAEKKCNVTRNVQQATHAATRKSIVQLFNVLGAAITLMFVRTTYATTVTRFQNLLQNYCILFGKLWPTRVVVNHHYCLHIEGTRMHVPVNLSHARISVSLTVRTQPLASGSVE